MNHIGAVLLRLSDAKGSCASRRVNTTDTRVDCPIMLVGAKPAGISTWLHLQKYAPQLAGRSIFIEKAVFTRDKLCSGGLSAWTANTLEHLGVELDVPSLHISDAEFRFGMEVYHFRPPDCFRVVERIEFDHALAKTAVDEADNKSMEARREVYSLHRMPKLSDGHLLQKYPYDPERQWDGGEVCI